MAKKQKVRLSDSEANRLNDLLKDKVLITKKGDMGRVTRITKGGIQVYLSKNKTIRSYPIYDTFVSGELRFGEIASQEEMLRSLYKAAMAANIIHPKDAEHVPKGPNKPCVSAIDVPGNVRLLCFFKNADERKLINHMRSVGLKGFEESLEEGFRQDPFVALRETEHYIGCSTRVLLYSFEELLRQVLKESFVTREWAWTRSVSDLLGDGSPYRTALCKNKDGKRSFFTQAVYHDNSMRQCTLMQVNITDARQGPREERIIQGRVLGPDRETVDAFNTAFNGAKRVSVIRASAVAAEPSVTASDPAFSEYARGKPVGNGRTPVGSAIPVEPTASGKVSVRQAKPIRVNEFLVRKSYGTHRANGHSLELVRATVTVLPKTGGDPRPIEFDGYWCPKCHKYFMTEGTYLRLKRQGYICCKVVEEKDLGTKKVGEGLYGNLASESILHMYGYTVNQQDDLSETERRTIISFVIENRIQSAQDIAHLLEWLISQRERNPRMAVAVGRWRDDLNFVRHYHKPTRRVRVDRIYAKI